MLSVLKEGADRRWLPAESCVNMRVWVKSACVHWIEVFFIKLSYLYYQYLLETANPFKVPKANRWTDQRGQRGASTSYFRPPGVLWCSPAKSNGNTIDIDLTLLVALLTASFYEAPTKSGGYTININLSGLFSTLALLNTLSTPNMKVQMNIISNDKPQHSYIA